MHNRPVEAEDPRCPSDDKPVADRVTVKAIGGLITVLALVEGLDIYRDLGLLLLKEQLFAVILGLALAATFIARRAVKSDRRRTPWYDWLAALVSLGASLYVAVDYMNLVDTIFQKPTATLVVSVIIVLSVVECLRRTAGMMLAGFVILFLLFGLFGHFIPGHFQGRDVAMDRLFIYLGIDSNGILGLPVAVVVSVVIAFIFFGNLLNKSGGSQFFTEISTALMGRYRGGSAKIAIVASSLFGAISGSAVSNVVSTGVMTIPMMRESGYPKEKAAAIEAVASTGGQLMPPMMGAGAFLMAEFLQVPFKEIILAALIPAALYYIALFIQSDLYAGRENIKPVQRVPVRALEVLARGWLYILPFVVIILGLFSLNLRPQTAAIYATVFLLPIALLRGYRGERMPWRCILEALCDTGVTVCQLLMVSAMAGIVIGVLNITGLGFALTEAITQLAGENVLVILILSALISIVLGMGMPTVGVYLLLATLIIPSMVTAGVPEMAAHMFAFYFGILSMITPPVAAAAFAAATIGESDFIKTGTSAMAFGWPAYVVPFIFVFAPEMLWQGSGWEIARIFVLSVMGVYLISVGWIGFFAERLSIPWRAAFFLVGVACLLPGSVIPMGQWLDGLGLLLGIALIVWKKRTAPTEKRHELSKA